MTSQLDAADQPRTAVIIVDHGSRREESNHLLVAVADAYRQHSRWPIVEPAHMELAEPSIATAFARCAEQGAQRVIVFPFFLGPGRHWTEDIPRLAARAAAACGNVPHLVTAPLGLDPRLLEVIDARIAHCAARSEGRADSCDLCTPATGCRLLPPA